MSPDIQVVLALIFAPFIEIIEKTGNIKNGILRSYWKGFENKENFHIVVMLGKPKLRGEMKLASANPMKNPILYPRYFSHPDDIKVMTDVKLKSYINDVERECSFLFTFFDYHYRHKFYSSNDRND